MMEKILTKEIMVLLLAIHWNCDMTLWFTQVVRDIVGSQIRLQL